MLKIVVIIIIIIIIDNISFICSANGDDDLISVIWKVDN